MEVGQGWSSGQASGRRALCGGLTLLICLLAGCALTRPHLDEALLAEDGNTARNCGVAECYLVACPDVLQVTIDGRPELSGACTVHADGRIDLGAASRVRVEGMSAAQIVRQVADEVDVLPVLVQVRVLEYNSQQVYLVGEVTGLQRAVPYQGPETVLDLLHRTGGIKPGAAPSEVHVIRAGVSEGRAPQVFHIDLRAIVLRHDERTNLRLQPFDQIWVGESRSSCFAKCIPPCFRELYDTIWGPHRRN